MVSSATESESDELRDCDCGRERDVSDAVELETGEQGLAARYESAVYMYRNEQEQDNGGRTTYRGAMVLLKLKSTRLVKSSPEISFSFVQGRICLSSA